MESYLTAEISASAVRHNLALLRKRLARGVKLCAVVKADCYGHGWQQLLPLISRESDMLAVATPEEAILLRRLGYELPILIFFSACAWSDGQNLRDALDELVLNQVTLTVVSAAEADWVAHAAARVGGPAMVHVKIDTGMGRSGVRADRAATLIQYIRNLPGIRLCGLYTHFANADESDQAVTNE